MICSMFVPICNRFHTKRANSGKITFFEGYPSLMPSFEGNLRTQRHEILSRKTRVLGVPRSDNFMILACTVLLQHSSVTDGQTDRQRDRQRDRQTNAHAIAKTREAFCYCA